MNVKYLLLLILCALLTKFSAFANDSNVKDIGSMITQGEYDRVLLILEGSEQPRRTNVYKAILNTKTYDINEVPFLTSVFVYASAQGLDDVSERGRNILSDKEFLRKVADRILLTLEKPSLIQDLQRSLLEEYPNKWLLSKFSEVSADRKDKTFMEAIRKSITIIDQR